MTVLGTSLASSASAQISEAQVDSLTSAYYLLQFDYDLLEAKSMSAARMDSLQLAVVVKSYEGILAAEKSKRKRTLWTIGITAVVTGTLYHLSRTID